MRKWNGILSAAILLLFLLHGILGGFQLLGVGPTALKRLARADVGLIAVHAVIGIKLTVDTLRAQRRAGVSYVRENRLFWARRVSGFAIMALLAFHLLAFSSSGSGGSYRLPPFGPSQLGTNLLLAAAVGLHVLTNLRPLLISLGASGLRKWIGDILLALAALLLFMAAGFLVYYLRWNIW